MMAFQSQGRTSYRMGGIAYQEDATIVPIGKWIVGVKGPAFNVR